MRSGGHMVVSESTSKVAITYLKTKYHPNTDTLRIPQFWQFYRYESNITRILEIQK